MYTAVSKVHVHVCRSCASISFPDCDLAPRPEILADFNLAVPQVNCQLKRQIKKILAIQHNHVLLKKCIIMNWKTRWVLSLVYSRIQR